MAQKKMTATVHEDTKHSRVVVIVEHGVSQSFSRAVIPKFHKALKEWMITESQIVPVSATFSSDLGKGFTQETEDLPYMERRTLSVFFVSY